MARTITSCLLLLALFSLAAPTGAVAAGLDDPLDQWLPSASDARWDWQWTESERQKTPMRERYVVASSSGPSFRIRWEELPDEPYFQHSGAIDFRRTDAGLVVTNWASTPPPPQYPVLCGNASDCGNSLDSAFYWIIWGNRSPALSEPLLERTRWSTVGGSGNDVTSDSRYVGRERISVPAFPNGVAAARVETDITQAGALGDPYGSGTRTVWWVYGVGPVRVVFDHASGETAVAELTGTNLTPRTPPSDESLLPLVRGDSMVFRWRNSRHLKRWSYQRVTVPAVERQSARIDVKHLRGPIRIAGQYVFTTRVSGVTNVSGAVKAATRARLPRLPNKRRLLTPVDLMVYGVNPVVPVNPRTNWTANSSTRDRKLFGARGRSRLIGRREVRVPAGVFPASVIRTVLSYRGSRFGSGTRTSWFAPGEGLVKLVLKHRDGSVSTVQRVR